MQDIYVGDHGKGFPLILVHGFLGSSLMWEPQINFFKDYFRVITPDLPGFGKSNKIKPLNTIHSLAILLSANIKKKKIDKFHLLGHSMGGMIVQEMTKIIGDKISKLICYSTGPIGELPKRFESIDQSIKNFQNKGLEVAAKNIAKTWFVKKENADYFNLCLKAGKQTSVIAAHESLTAMKNWNGVDKLKNIQNETLILWGDQDKSYNLNQAQILKENIPNSSLEIVKDCAHNIHLEKPEIFNRIVLNYLNKQ